MPLYEYLCRSCNERMEVLRSMSQRSETVTCVSCGRPAQRVLSVFAAVSKGADGESQPVAGGGCACAAGGGCACAAR